MKQDKPYSFTNNTGLLYGAIAGAVVSPCAAGTTYNNHIFLDVTMGFVVGGVIGGMVDCLVKTVRCMLYDNNPSVAKQTKIVIMLSSNGKQPPEYNENGTERYIVLDEQNNIIDSK